MTEPPTIPATQSRRPVLVHGFILLVCLGFAVWHLPRVQIQEPESRIELEPDVVETAPAMEIPDFAAIQNTDQRKAAFFSFLRPFVDQVNGEMLSLRAQVEALSLKRQAGTLNSQDKAVITRLSREFEVQPQNPYSRNHFIQLLRRIDVLPVSLVLAQAANESAWGTSRFALDGNNFFGQWCYVEGCGIVPNRRRSGATHEVKAFDSVADSVRGYFMNLNTFPSYRKLRLIRQELRDEGQEIDGISLSEGLDSYSERGGEYIQEVQSMIYYNDLHELDFHPDSV